MKNIELIKIDLNNDVILSHPKQSEMYGEESLDKDFVESIRLQGVLQKPVVTYFGDIAEGFTEEERAKYSDETIVFVSGHRRLRGSIEAGYDYLICELKRYGNYFDSEVDLITYNKQRKKSKRQIANELQAYKQKLSQVRILLEKEGLEALDKIKSFNFRPHLKVDGNGRHYLPYATELIEKDLKISRSHQQQLTTIFDEEWLQDKVEKINLSNRNSKEKERMTKAFVQLINEAREEVDKEDGLSVNKCFKEIMRVWNDTEEIINPKPKPKKKKRQSVTKKWLKPKDFAKTIDATDLEVDSPEAHIAIDDKVKNVVILNGSGKAYVVDKNVLLKYLKEQGI